MFMCIYGARVYMRASECLYKCVRIGLSCMRRKLFVCLIHLLKFLSEICCTNYKNNKIPIIARRCSYYTL